MTDGANSVKTNPHGMTRASDPLRVVVVGGGFAAAEAVLALRAYARDRVDIELVAPKSRLFFRPAATAAPFTDVAVQSFELAALAEQIGSTLVRDRVEAVAPSVTHPAGIRSTARLRSDARRPRPRSSARSRDVPRPRDVAQLQRVVQELRSGPLDGLALTVPAGVSWTLPVYELALLAAAEVKRLGLDTRISLVTPNPQRSRSSAQTSAPPSPRCSPPRTSG
jgi:sulfide:quinone oxidoreductase